jgi:hypothetical protein
MRKHSNYLGFGDVTIGTDGGTPFTVMRSVTDIHAINRAALINTAPTEEPKKHQYPTHLSWFKAFTKWKVAQQGKGSPS